MTKNEPGNAESAGVSAFRLLALAAFFLLLTRFAGPLWLRILPAPLLARLDLPTFSMLAQGTTLALGLGLAFLLFRDPLRVLGLARPSKLALSTTLLLTPALFIAIATLALRIAMPWLLEELAQGRAHASRENAGELGRAVTEAPLLVMLLGGAFFAAIVEELCFRGALWASIREVLLRIRPGAKLITGIVATVLAAALFGLMHADMPGAVGIVRIVATTGIGLACGFARQITGTLLAPMLLHFAHNTLTIGIARKWMDDGSPPLLGVLPNPLLGLAALGLVMSLALTIRARAISRPRYLL